MIYFKNKKIQHLLDKAKAVIFDMNGLIVDDERFQLAAASLVFKKMGITILKNDWINKYVGHTAKYVFTDLLKNIEIPSQQKINKIDKQKNIIYGQLMRAQIKKVVRPGTVNLIKYLYQNHYKLAVATSASSTEVEIALGKKGLDLIKYFDCVIDIANIKKAKPDPEIYKLAMKKLDVSPKETLIFEDTALGIESARRAGARAVAVPSKFTKKQNFKKANLVINNLTKNAKLL